MRTFFIAGALVLCSYCLSNAAASGTAYGEPLQGIAKVDLTEVLAAAKPGTKVRLEGTVDGVCTMKGCWLDLKQGDKVIHVSMGNEKFFVPTDCKGKKVVLEGTVKVEKPDPKVVEHLEGEGSKAAASKVSIVATGVELY